MHDDLRGCLRRQGRVAGPRTVLSLFLGKLTVVVLYQLRRTSEGDGFDRNKNGGDKEQPSEFPNYASNKPTEINSSRFDFAFASLSGLMAVIR
jgi:hypothetical protein